MKLFDSHCHLDFDTFDSERALVLQRAQERGVRAIVVPGVVPGMVPVARSSAPHGPETEIRVYYAAGIHPAHVARLSRDELEQGLSELALRARSSRAVAIGECGLDKPCLRGGGATLARQRAVFEAEIDVANELELPAMLHIVGFHGEALNILRARHLVRGGVVHAYSGSAELVSDYAALGCYFGVSGLITHPHARRLKEAVRRMPRDRLVLETDAPDQAPLGVLAGRNEPATLVEIARALARELDLDVHELANLTWQNAERLYQLE